MSYYCPDVVNPVRPKFDHFNPEPVTQGQTSCGWKGENSRPGIMKLRMPHFDNVLNTAI